VQELSLTRLCADAQDFDRTVSSEDHMHSNASLLNKFYEAVQVHDHETIADCYHPMAMFKDIAFELEGKKKIHAMWRMIADTNLRISYHIENANERGGTACWVADYTFKDTGREVHNELESTFQFQDGLILTQVDDCNPWNWGKQALGPAYGFVSWLIPAVLRKKAKAKLDDFVSQHPEYQ
jgi:ketosteroid isomerase-like protein